MSLFWLNYIWQTVSKAFHSPLKFRVLFSIYNHYSIPHLHFNTEVLLSRWQTNNFMVHKILPIDNATLFLSSFKYFRRRSEIEFNSLIFMHLDSKENKQTTHHHEVSFKTLSTIAIKQEMVFPRNSKSLQIFFSMNRVYFNSWRRGKNETFFENIPCHFVSQGKVARTF